MKKFCLILGLLFAAGVSAQQVTVTATITSPDGKIYAGATGTAVLVTPGNAQPMYGSQTVNRNPQPISGINGFGTFSIQLWNTTLLSPVPVFYRFNITDATGKCSFQTATVAISGPVDLSTFISSYAAPLAPCQGGGGGGGTPGGSNGQVQYNSSGTFGGAPGVTTNGTSLTVTNNVTVGGLINNATLSAGQCVSTDGSKNLVSTGSTCVPGGVLNSVQFNSPLGTFGGDSTLNYDPTLKNFCVGTNNDASTGFCVSTTATTPTSGDDERFVNSFYNTTSLLDTFGIYSTINANHNLGTKDHFVGLFGDPTLQGNGNVTDYWSVVGDGGMVGTGTVTNFNNFHAILPDPLNGTITNAAAYYAESLAGIGGHTYSFYSENTGSGASDYSYYSDGGQNLFKGLVNTNTGYQYNGAAPLNHCLVGNGTNYVDSSSCAGTSSLSSITAATTGNSIANGVNQQTWNWHLTSPSSTGMVFSESSASTGSGSTIIQIDTMSGSTAIPLSVADNLNGSQAIPTVSINPVWNTTGVPTGLLLNVGHTASGTGSKLADFQINSTSEWNVDKSGNSKQLGTATIGGTTLTGSSSGSLTLPAATDTLVARATTDTLTNKTFDTAGTGNHFKINGTAITAITGNTGLVVTGSGTYTPGDCLNIDANGNAQDSGSGCSGGATFGWSGVTAGTNSNAGNFLMTGNVLNLLGTTRVLQRASAGLVTTTNGDLGYDTTNKNWHAWANGVDTFVGIVPVSVAPVNGDCVAWSVSSSIVTLNDTGAGCGGTAPTFKTNGSNNSTQSLLNITNSSLYHSLGVTVTNTSGGIANLGLTGSLDLAGLTSPSANGDTVCASSLIWTECTPGVGFSAFSSTGITLASTVRGTMIANTHSGATAWALPQAGSAGFGNSFYFRARNDGTANLTITPATSTIQRTGQSAASTLVVGVGEACNIQSDNTNYFADCSYLNTDYTGPLTASTYSTATNCSSSASPAVCSAAPAGSVNIAATGTSIVVDTTAVTANSQIFVQFDSSLGTRLSVTCSTQSILTTGTPVVTARTAGTSFTISVVAPDAAHPICLSYSIVN